MRKFIVFMLSVLVIFAMCSCQPTENMDGLVAFSASTQSMASKAIEANDPGKALVQKIQLKFTAINQTDAVVNGFELQTSADGSNKYSDWKDNLINSTNGSWNGGTSFYLSQGQWKIEARAVDKESGDIADENIIYYGFVNVYISKVTNSAKVKMTPKTTGAKGTLAIGYDANGDTSKITSHTVVSKEANKQRVKYDVYNLSGETVTTEDYLLGESTTNDITSYEQRTISTLNQGSYIIAMTIEQWDGSDWIDSTGGSAVDFGIYKDKTTYVWGDIKPSDYIKTSVTTEMDVDSDIGLDLTYASGTYTASVTLPVGKTVDKYLWFVDGSLHSTDTSSQTDTFTPSLSVGEHIIQCVAVNTSEKTKSPMKGKKAVSNSTFDDFDVTDLIGF